MIIAPHASAPTAQIRGERSPSAPMACGARLLYSARPAPTPSAEREGWHRGARAFWIAARSQGQQSPTSWVDIPIRLFLLHYGRPAGSTPARSTTQNCSKKGKGARADASVARSSMRCGELTASYTWPQPGKGTPVVFAGTATRDVASSSVKAADGSRKARTPRRPHPAAVCIFT